MHDPVLMREMGDYHPRPVGYQRKFVREGEFCSEQVRRLSAALLRRYLLLVWRSFSKREPHCYRTAALADSLKPKTFVETHCGVISRNAERKREISAARISNQVPH